MSRKNKNYREESEKKRKPEMEGDEPFSRDEELCHKDELRATLTKLYDDVEKAVTGQTDRVNDTLDYWDMYNCILGGKQYYNGTSKIFLPLVHNAVNARKTRFTNQIFPSSQRNVEVISEDSNIPNGLVSLIEHYIRKAKLRTQIIPALVKNGDIEGQYTVYVDWIENKRDVVYKRFKPLEIELAEDELMEDDDEQIEDIVEEEVTHAYPSVEVLSDADFVVFPATSNSIEEAMEVGGGAVILRRWSKATIKQKIADGLIDKEGGDALLAVMGAQQQGGQPKDTAKAMTDAAGIKKDARGSFALVYEVWTKLSYKLPGDHKPKKRIYKIFFGGPNAFLSCKRNPWWSDKLPIISTPVEKVVGSFKGKSKISAGVSDLQILANDAVNEGMDSAAYALLPIVMTDPEKNPRVSSMIMSLAAIWETSPNDTQFAQFPQLWREAFDIIGAAKAEINQTLSVSPAAITQALGKKKPSQAEIAMEQQVDILTTSDAVTNIEEGILTPMLQRMLELDHQHRNDSLLIQQFGEMGVSASMERVEPIQFHRRWELRWFGVEAARAAAQVQQQISAVNVLRGIPPELYEGYKLSLVPVIKQLVENVFGHRLAPHIFIDVRAQLAKDARVENMNLYHGEMVIPNEMDNHQQHMAMHQQSAQELGDPHRTFEMHVQMHKLMMQKQEQARMQAQQPKGVPGAPGGAPQGQQEPGLPGQGAVPRGPNAQNQQPNGAIPQDQMAAAGSPMMPRRMG
jgi:hypothetical protein